MYLSILVRWSWINDTLLKDIEKQIISDINHIAMIVEACNNFDKGKGVNIASLWKNS